MFMKITNKLNKPAHARKSGAGTVLAERCCMDLSSGGNLNTKCVWENKNDKRRIAGRKTHALRSLDAGDGVPSPGIRMERRQAGGIQGTQVFR